MSENDKHYLGAIRIRLCRLYEVTRTPNIREQISDEVDWIDEKLAEADTAASVPAA